MAIRLNRRMQGAASGRYLNNRRASLRNVTGGIQSGNGIAPGDNPKGQTGGSNERPWGANAQGYSPIRYGQNGLKWGYAKVGQARNQGAPPPPPGTGNPYDTGWGQGGANDMYDTGNNGNGGGGGGQGNGNGGNGQGNGGNGGGNGGLPTLSPRLQAWLQHYGRDAPIGGMSDAQWYNWGGEGSGGIPVNTLRRFLREGKAAGLSNKELLAFTNKSFRAGMAGPIQDNTLTRYVAQNYTPEQWQSLSAFAGGMHGGQGGQDPNGMGGQTDLLAQFPDLWDAYIRAAYPNNPEKAEERIAAYNKTRGIGNDPATGQPWAPPEAPAKPRPGQTVAPGGYEFMGSPTAASQAPFSNPGGQVGAGQVSPKGAGQQVGMVQPGNQIADAQAQAQAQQAANQTQMQLQSLPLDPQFEGQRRMLQAQLDRQLSEINASYGRLGAEQNLAQSRLDTNRGNDEQSLLENMAGRGTVNSSIYGDNRESLATDYGRMQTDLGISIADALAGLSGQQGDAYSNYDQGLIELLSQSASGFMEDPLSANVSQQGWNMGGGGGGKWEPTWKPKGKRGRRGRRGNR